MTTFDKSQSPYFDDYDPSKNYTHMLAVPGRVEQARDFTQMQTMMFDFLKRLSDSLMKNGTIISGMGFNVQDNFITVEDGKVYLDGKVHNFTKQQISITKIDTELIGVKLEETLVTEDEDTSLLDRTTTAGNFGQPGTYRIKSTITLTLNDADASPICELRDGVIYSEVPKPQDQFGWLFDILANRTYDESGNYRVSGLDLVCEPYDADNLNIIVEPGTAYVKGYQVLKDVPVKTLAPISKESRSLAGELKVYNSTEIKYALSNYPVKSISRLTAFVQVTETVTRGAIPNSSDFLNNTPVIEILSVTKSGVTYTPNTDYKLNSTNDGIDWSPAGIEPASGTTYSVTYKYNRLMTQGLDYELYQEVGEFGETKDYVRWLAGSRPVNGSTFYIDYDFYLARMDSVSIDKDGKIVVTTGQSDIPRNVGAPFVDNPDLLPLGAVFFPPNSGKAKPTSKTTTRLDMAQLQRLSSRVSDIEFNQAITALDREAIEGEIATDLRGIFSDSFRSIERADMSNPLFDILYDLEMGNIMLPIISQKVTAPTVSNASSVKKFDKMTTLPMTEVVSISQLKATTTMKINPYLAFNSMGLLKLTPNVDNWIETSTMQIAETRFEARKFYRWWSHASKLHDVADLFGLKIVEGAPVGTLVENWKVPWEAGEFQSAVAVKTEKSTEIIKEALTYMRQIQVQVQATNLQPATDNLTCTFDGRVVALTPVSGYSAGSQAGTMRANSSGEVKATFTIPASVRTGTREVRLFNNTNNATGAFTAIGTKKTTINKIITTRISLTAVDPLAQTFQFDKDTMLRAVGVYFAAKDTTNNVIVQIRNVVNGYPGNMIFAEQVLAPSQILVSNNASAETKVTFDDPVVCAAGQQYCVTYLTDSATHTLYVCDLGGKDVTTGTRVSILPYQAGMLFSSSNAITWTAHQSMSMKFKIYTCKFNTSTTVDFTEQTNLSADRLLLIADALVPLGTKCEWQVSIDGAAYQSLPQGQDIDLIKVGSKAKLRAILTTTNTSMSPILALDSVVLTAFTQGLVGTYVGRNVELVDPITEVKQTFEAIVPNGCSVIPKFSYDDGATWQTGTIGTVTPISAEFSRYEASATIPLAQQALKYRARLDITSNSAVLRPVVRKFTNIMK